MSEIQLSVDEMVAIMRFIQEISIQLDTEITPAIQSLNALDFYKQGEAKEVMSSYDEANNRFLELQDHYSRAFTVVMDILQSMMEADETVAREIIAKLGV